MHRWVKDWPSTTPESTPIQLSSAVAYTCRKSVRKVTPETGTTQGVVQQHEGRPVCMRGLDAMGAQSTSGSNEAQLPSGRDDHLPDILGSEIEEFGRRPREEIVHNLSRFGQFGAALRTSYQVVPNRVSMGLELAIASGDRAPGFGNRPWMANTNQTVAPNSAVFEGTQYNLANGDHDTDTH